MSWPDLVPVFFSKLKRAFRETGLVHHRTTAEYRAAEDVLILGRLRGGAFLRFVLFFGLVDCSPYPVIDDGLFMKDQSVVFEYEFWEDAQLFLLHLGRGAAAATGEAALADSWAGLAAESATEFSLFESTRLLPLHMCKGFHILGDQQNLLELLLG